MRGLAPILLLVAAPASAEQFDMACQGTQLSQRNGAAAPYSTRLRVDTDAKQWCMDDCAHVLSINDVAADKLVLASDFTLNTRVELTNDISLDPKSGAFHMLQIQARPEEKYLKADATCTRQPFTAFPAPKP